MGLLDILKPAPYKEEIEDEAVVKKKYKYWRLRIFYSMYIGYVFFYFTRKSFTFATPGMIQDLGFDKADLGILASILAITYGLSKFISGLISDRSNARYFMAIGLIMTGVLNIFFGFSSSIYLFAVFWGLNGLFQGWGWPPTARLLTHWYSQKERGTWWGIWNTSHSVGGAAIPLVVSGALYFLGWRYALFIPGILSIAIGIFLINRLRDTPQSLGLPTIEKFKGESVQEKGAEHELSTKEILFKYVLKNKYIWVLGFSYFFIYIIRTAMNDWSNLFLIESKEYSTVVANACISWFEIGGILGSLAAGWTSDKIFKGKRGPINVLFTLGVMGAIGGLWISPANAPFLASSLLFASGFFIFGPQMLIGMAAAELSHKKAAGSATGFIGWIAYLGAAVAGYPLGKITQIFGWSGYFVILGVCGAMSVLLLLPLWNVKSREKLKEKPEVEIAPDDVQEA